MRQQIGTVRVTRTRIYQLDPQALERWNPATVIVEPGEYPLYLDGFTRYWRMTGVLNHRSARLGDGMFTMNSADVPSEDDVVFYSRRYGPDEWAGLLAEFAAETNPALVFTLLGAEAGAHSRGSAKKEKSIFSKRGATGHEHHRRGRAPS